MSKPASAVEARKIEAAVRREKGGPLRIEPLELEGPRDDGVLVPLLPGSLETFAASRSPGVHP